MKWFKHDSNASMDAKLSRVRSKYGMEGYGVYWYCLELISQNIDKHNLTFELEHDAELIALSTGLHYEIIQEMMQEFVSLGLFENTDGIITCLKMATRTDEYTQKVIKTNKKAITLSRQTPDSVGTKSGLIEENRTNRREEKRRRFTPPSLEQIKLYCSTRKNNVDPVRFLDHYETNGWMRGRNRIKDWKACVRTWESKEKESSYGAGAI